jgi:hypothetical protein
MLRTLKKNWGPATPTSPLGYIIWGFYPSPKSGHWRFPIFYKTDSSHQCDLRTFKYGQDFEIYGRQQIANGDKFSLSDSDYVAATAYIFTSHEDTQRMLPQVVEHFAR